MVLVPGGGYDMGNDSAYAEERPVHRVTVESFYMDDRMVTNEEFRRFCEATGTPYPENPGWPTMPDYFRSYPDYPVVNVAHWVARDYARWAGKRLPTEEEWEYAARGGLTGAVYPWGDEPPDGHRANFADRNTRYPWREFRHSSGFEYTSPVGSFAPNAYGLYDMAGNLWQWCEDWFFRYDDTIRDTAAFADGWGGSRVCRGGCYHSNAMDLRVARRKQVLAGTGLISVGFRCVRDANEPHAEPVGDELQPKQWDYALSDLPKGSSGDMRLCMGVKTLGRNEAEAIKRLGFTSVEQYVTWETVENGGRDSWDFSLWDEQVAIIQSAGLKWVPFLIAGPAYSLPDWFRESRDFSGLQCLEHGLESGVQTIWDMQFRSYVDRFLRAIADRYADKNLIEAVLIGITGDFGESIFPDWHGNWTTQIPGLYHSHAGYWSADPYAREAFLASIRERYVTVEELNDAWGTRFASYADVRMPELTVDPLEGFRVDEYTKAGSYTCDGTPTAVRWLDFVDWYRASMTEFAGYWLKTTRDCFPDHLVYLCTGGNAVPYHGADFAQQCKIAAQYDCGVRITNEASNYARNFILTNWVASSGRYYGAYFGFEPAGKVTESGIVRRIYNATATGAEELHFYSPNILGSSERAEIFSANLKYLFRTDPVTPIAVLYPDVPIVVGDITSVQASLSMEILRDYTDYRFVDDLTIKDGVLEDVACLIICGGSRYRTETLMAIVSWVEDGGSLVVYNTSNISAVDTGEDYSDRLLNRTGGRSLIGRGATLYIPIRISAEAGAPDVQPLSGAAEVDVDTTLAYYQDAVFEPITAFLAERGLPVVDGRLDAVYCTETRSAYLVLNTNANAINRELTHEGRSLSVTAPADSVTVVEKPL